MRFVYLEGGSGAAEPLSPRLIRTVRSVLDVPLIVGGGIRTEEHARRAVEAGADLVVTGTLAERDVGALGRVISALKEAGAKRKA
jgi:phosphoglycerol geranylgeranyltransferase